MNLILKAYLSNFCKELFIYLINSVYIVHYTIIQTNI